jgi:hypothetical protein
MIDWAQKARDRFATERIEGNGTDKTDETPVLSVSSAPQRPNSLKRERPLLVSSVATSHVTANAPSALDTGDLAAELGVWAHLPSGLATAYYCHHFSCPFCIAAGRGRLYGNRCSAGMELWMQYQDSVQAGDDRRNR